MENHKIDLDEQQRRSLQEYIFDLEETKEKAESLSIAHDKLQRSQDLLLTVLSCTNHGMCLIENSRLVWCNQAFMDIFGWDHEILIGKTLEVLCRNAEAYGRISEGVDGAIRQGRRVAHEYEFVHEDGREVECLVTGRALDERDHARGYVLSLTDVTERNRSQEALKSAYEKLEQHSSQLVRINEQLNREIEERKRAEEKLNRYREQLEELVRARTAELTTVNEQLRQEVVERRRAEEDLQQANDYLESILKDSPDAIAIADQHGTLVKWSKMAAGICGSDYGDFRGRRVFEYYADPEQLNRMLTQLRRDGFISKYEVQIKRKKGDSFPAEVSISLLKNTDNETIGSVAIVRDLSHTKNMLDELRNTNEKLNREIAARKEIEVSLRKSENEYRTIFENTGTATVILEEDATIALVNFGYEVLSGYSRSEVEDKRKWTEFVVEEDLKWMKEYHRLRRTSQEGVPRQYEFRFRTRSGDIRHIFLTVAMIPGSTRSVASLLDVTEQKRMEAEALKAQKLESIGILAGGIAHDFNNILTAVIGNISLAKMYAEPETKVRKRLEETEKAAQRAKELTQQLLTFSRGGKPVKRTVVISELIKESATFALRGSNVKLELSLPEDLWPVEIDEGQISQVMSNLIINADQAMPEGGTVRIEAENTSLGPAVALPLKPGRYVTIGICDQGIGIGKDLVDKIFDPYFTTKQHGSGLGLATVYSIIKGHDGCITVDSEMGKGTRFHIYLPASEKEAPATTESHEEPIAGKGRILVMDDEVAVREVLGELLDYLGYEVAFAGDGAEALELYQKAKTLKQPYDVVMMDLTVPGGMGGKETIKRLLQIDPEVKAIVSSGYSNDPVMADFKQHGFVGVVSKPYTIEQISDLLHPFTPGTSHS
ncbi:MAG TPA: hypothetical protein DCZ69_00500 [Syntrophobacteraceae bacterium]|nr:hypothetical protein [Syntrophobacteraceae bacterium]